MIQNISIDKLHPHPDNPRKDLGDLTELAESIKKQGILQNLTVVPWFSEITRVGCDFPEQQERMGYRIVIGHRRHAASKLAGLTELPCVIVEMTPQEQVATMLLENIQRADLTVYEQAQGFQLMINFGETLHNIAEKTGFSETTIRRRVKLLELDPKKFKTSAERNVTLMEYVELEKIEDITLRNKVLDSIGTPNFKYELQRAIDKEKNEKELAIIVEQLNKFATELKDSNGLRYIKSYYPSQKDELVEIPKDADVSKYFYVINSYGSVTLYGEKIETEEDTAAKEQRELQRARYNSLEEISQRAFNLRCEFVKSISNSKAKKNMAIIIEHSIYSMIESHSSIDLDDIADFLNIQMPEDEDEEFGFDDIVENLRQQPERYMLIATYLLIDSSREGYYTWYGTHEENTGLDRTYEFLKTFGYEISDEEQAMRDGTHELFGEVDR
ncbi:MAG: ParB/RepB/Spo0J family partition protein [Sedimentibacter sp.]